jgi:cell division protein FtsZ
MISYTRDPRQTIPATSVKIIGLGGAGVNMLERVALDGMDGSELLALNTDLRTLSACLAMEKIQLGVSLTRGLGSGGDPALGHQAVLEAEGQIRASIKDCRIVFLCTGLGGGTGSGAAPIVTRIAREEGAFVVVFATMPFAFEGKRRHDQAETALNELAVLSNALVTFDNNRMGELVLAKQGIHEAFSAADHIICESIKAVIRLVVRPGLINVGLDELMSALRTNRSRCLFGSGLGDGKDRAAKALKNALNSPLLDQGALLKDAHTVLVHLSGGEDLTLFEIELLMQRLQKFVPENAHILFGAAIDPAMGDSLSITLISALPEDSLSMAPRKSLSQHSRENPILDASQEFTPPPAKAAEIVAAPESLVAPEPVLEDPPVSLFGKAGAVIAAAAAPSLFDNERPYAEPEPAAPEPAKSAPERHMAAFTFIEPEPEAEPEAEEEAPPLPENEPELIENTDTGEAAPAATGFMPGPQRRPSLTARWGKPKPAQFPEDSLEDGLEPVRENTVTPQPASPSEPEPPKLKLGIKSSGPQSELSLDSAPRGRFEGETPNVFDGEDLDLPPFLRKKK